HGAPDDRVDPADDDDDDGDQENDDGGEADEDDSFHGWHSTTVHPDDRPGRDLTYRPEDRTILACPPRNYCAFCSRGCCCWRPPPRPWPISGRSISCSLPTETCLRAGSWPNSTGRPARCPTDACWNWTCPSRTR